MRLIVIGSSSKGNSYALLAENGEILLLEAGVPLGEVNRAIGYNIGSVVGCCVSHEHSDHSKCVGEYLKAGIEIYSNASVADRYFGAQAMPPGETTLYLGGFAVTPFSVKHDVANFGYLINHQEMGTLFFSTDCYDLRFVIHGVNTFMAECNYEDSILEKSVREGHTNKKQADRVRLSHMSLAHCVEWLRECHADESAKQIILIHGSSRHLVPELAVNKVQQVVGIPTYYARKGLELNLRR